MGKTLLDYNVIVQYLPNLKNNPAYIRTQIASDAFSENELYFNPTIICNRYAGGLESDNHIQKDKSLKSVFSECWPFSKKQKKISEKDDTKPRNQRSVSIMEKSDKINGVNKENHDNKKNYDNKENYSGMQSIFYKQDYMTSDYALRELGSTVPMKNSEMDNGHKSDNTSSVLRRRVCYVKTEDVPKILFRYRNETEFKPKKPIKSNYSLYNRRLADSRKIYENKLNKINKWDRSTITSKEDSRRNVEFLKLKHQHPYDKHHLHKTSHDEKSIKDNESLLDSKTPKSLLVSKTVPQPVVDSNKSNLRKYIEEEKTDKKQPDKENAEDEAFICIQSFEAKSTFDMNAQCEAPKKSKRLHAVPQVLDHSQCVEITDKCSVPKSDICWMTKIPDQPVQSSCICSSLNKINHDKDTNNTNNLFSTSRTSKEVETMTKIAMSTTSTSTDILCNRNSNDSMPKNQNDPCIDFDNIRAWNECSNNLNDEMSKIQNDPCINFDNIRASNECSNNFNRAMSKIQNDPCTDLQNIQNTNQYLANSNGSMSKVQNVPCLCTDYREMNSNLQDILSKCNLKEIEEMKLSNKHVKKRKSKKRNKS